MKLPRPMQLITAAALAAIALGNFARAEDLPSPKPMTIVVYEGGPAWQVGKPPQEQHLNAHFAYVGDAFKQGRLVAYGAQVDAVRGYYLLNTADPYTVKAFTDEDPAIKSGVLTLADTIGWGVLIDAFAPNGKDENFFLMRYQPGPAWVKGQSLAGQNVSEHLAYVTEQVKKGVVVAGGPKSTADEGIYIVRAVDQSAALAFTVADPGVASGIFKPVVIGWNVIAMQPPK